VTFNDNLLYHPADLDIGAILKEDADQLIETLDLPEMQVSETAEDENDLLEFVTEVPTVPESETERSCGQRQLLTPSPSVISSENHPQAPANLPAAPGNQAQRGNEISADFNPQNIIEGSRARTSTRKAAYITALEKNNELGGYYTSFVTATKLGRTIQPLRLHRDTLPPPPTSWKQMLKHEHSIEFKKAADKEFEALLQKETFKYVEKSNINDKLPLLPLMWVFTYKFDQDGFLLKHKARLVARGDLQYTAEDTYAATLAAQTFRAVMAIVAAFDLETRQYDAVNAFANATLPTPIPCYCAEGYERSGFVLWVQKA